MVWQIKFACHDLRRTRPTSFHVAWNARTPRHCLEKAITCRVGYLQRTVSLLQWKYECRTARRFASGVPCPVTSCRFSVSLAVPLSTGSFFDEPTRVTFNNGACVFGQKIGSLSVSDLGVDKHVSDTLPLFMSLLWDGAVDFCIKSH